MNDLFIIGGGINGTGIAALAASRGLSVSLHEQNDLASGTSWTSSKLIHGGLRYLEQYDFRLVRESLKERDILLQKAPHLISPLKFIMPHNPNKRPAWLIRFGLFLYDRLGGTSSLPSSGQISLKQSKKNPLKTRFKKGFHYYDARVDDARLVISNALEAKTQGATIVTRSKVTQATWCDDHWKITTRSGDTEKIHHARCLINAAGPWVSISNHTLSHPDSHHVRLVKGSHLIVPRLYEADHAYLLQHDDNRVVFVLPFSHDTHLIGTTDVAVEGNPADADCSDEEIEYLLALFNDYFEKPIRRADIIGHFSGVRALYDDDDGSPASLSRDYFLSFNEATHLLTIYGGKITTYRRLAVAALDKLSSLCEFTRAMPKANTPLPGACNPKALFESAKKQYPWLETTILKRYCENYGDNLHSILKGATQLSDMGESFGAGLMAKEVDYLIQHEWAHTADDILWRRTKHALLLTAAQKQRLSDYAARSQNCVRPNKGIPI